ncbi:MAG TPA: DUF4239 domain-containing protein [Acidimicrobiales bacterium]|nr:DUF4239 domain-containing protein [Acidimicrobiales bacterium]
MAEWLLRTFPTAVLSILILAGLTGAALLGLFVFRTRASDLVEAVDDSVAGVIVSILAGIYGVVVAFVIVVLWEDFRSAQQVASSEANALGRMVQDSNAFPPSDRLILTESISRYVHAVVDEEWEAMGSGNESPEAAAAMDGLYGALREVQPEDPVTSAFYAEASSNLGEVDTARRERIRLSQRGLPAVLQLLIVGGALLIIGFTYLFTIESRAAHVTMTAGVALLLGFTLLLALLLQSPFSGNISVKSMVFREGPLAEFWR